MNQVEALTPRQERGLQIARASRLSKRGAMWRVPSQSGSGRYSVLYGDKAKGCSCPDFELRGLPCKHVYAVEFTITLTKNDLGDTQVERSVKITYAQNWPAYNAAQVHEKEYFLRLLSGLCDGITEVPQQGRGRPRLSLRDLTFAACYKVFSGFSGRRFMTDLSEAKRLGFIAEAPCYNSVFKAFGREDLTDVLSQLITRSALPLRRVETDFAIDSTGFGSSKFIRWFDTKHGSEKRQNVWVKCHAMVGVKTNVVTSLEVTPMNTGDAPQLPALVKRTAENFTMAEISGDKAYMSFANLEAIDAAGAAPFIPFKSTGKPSINGHVLWDKLYALFTLQREDFLASYHKRSNVESTFSAIKRLFGDSVRSKNERAMINEVLLKVFAFNLSCIVHAIFELGIKPDFLGNRPNLWANEVK